jgi:hypothetical protein
MLYVSVNDFRRMWIFRMMFQGESRIEQYEPPPPAQAPPPDPAPAP